MRAAREDDLLPENEHPARLARRERDRGSQENIAGLRETLTGSARLAPARRNALKEHVLARLVDPDDQGVAPLVDRDRGIVHVVEPGLVHPPRPALGAAGRDLGAAVPGKRLRRLRGSGDDAASRRAKRRFMLV